jgi:hypothetical protein
MCNAYILPWCMQVRVPDFPGDQPIGGQRTHLVWSSVNVTWDSILTKLGVYLWTRPDLE